LFALTVVHQDLSTSLSLLNDTLGCDFNGEFTIEWEYWSGAFSKVVSCPEAAKVVDSLIRLAQKIIFYDPPNPFQLQEFVSTSRADLLVDAYRTARNALSYNEYSCLVCVRVMQFCEQCANGCRICNPFFFLCNFFVSNCKCQAPMS
jgi:hypothetical protein